MEVAVRLRHGISRKAKRCTPLAQACTSQQCAQTDSSERPSPPVALRLAATSLQPISWSGRGGYLLLSGIILIFVPNADTEWSCLLQRSSEGCWKKAEVPERDIGWLCTPWFGAGGVGVRTSGRRIIVEWRRRREECGSEAFVRAWMRLRRSAYLAGA